MSIEDRKRMKLLRPKQSTLCPSGILENDGANSLNWNDLRYPQYRTYYDSLLERFWRPEDVKMGKDDLDYSSATTDVQEAYKLGLGNLTAIDVIQTRLAMLISMAITDPSIGACYAVAGQQEAVHEQSYSYALSAKLSADEQNKVFLDSIRNEKAQLRNSLVIDVLEELEDAYKLYIFNELEQKEFVKYLARALVAMSVLEGINFYSTFMMFYYFRYRYEILSGTTEIITYINKDEYLHTYLNGQTHRALLTDYPLNEEEETQHIQWSLDFIKENVKREIEYGKDLFTKIKVKPSEIDIYTHWLGNIRAQALGLPLPFPDYPHKANENPVPWMKAFSDERLDSGKKTDFFENTVTQYTKSTSEMTDMSEDDLDQLKF